MRSPGGPEEDAALDHAAAERSEVTLRERDARALVELREALRD